MWSTLTYLEQAKSQESQGGSATLPPQARSASLCGVLLRDQPCTRATRCLLQVQIRALPSQRTAGQDNLPPLLLCSFPIILQVWSLLMMQQEVQKSKSPLRGFLNRPDAC